MSTPFEGVLAVIGRSTKDGRRLAPHDPALGPLTRDLPLVIVTHEGIPDGRIERVWVDGDLVRYAGRVSDVTAKMIRLKLVVAGMDIDRAEFEVEPDDLSVVLVGWRVAGATIDPYDQRAWEEVSMTIIDETERAAPLASDQLVPALEVPPLLPAQEPAPDHGMGPGAAHRRYAEGRVSKQEPEDDEQRDPSMTDQALTIWKEPWPGDDES